MYEEIWVKFTNYDDEIDQLWKSTLERMAPFLETQVKLKSIPQNCKSKIKFQVNATQINFRRG